MELSAFSSEKQTRCWVACIDLLGFSDAVVRGDWATIISIYEQSLEELAESPGRSTRVNYTWFSDTFLLYTNDDSAASFLDIEILARLFVGGLVLRQIPMHGALSCGGFFAHAEDNIFIGPALVEAYRLCEDQNWIGFVLSPSALKQLVAVEIGVDALMKYRYYNIPRKKGKNPRHGLPALILGWPKRNDGRNDCYESLKRMRECAGKCSVRRKYDRTLRFLNESD
ncbi:MAG: hypothetical protein ACLFO5_07345 [Opitutales bacterium]